jgi:hypothetical protein
MPSLLLQQLQHPKQLLLVVLVLLQLLLFQNGLLLLLLLLCCTGFCSGVELPLQDLEEYLCSTTSSKAERWQLLMSTTTVYALERAAEAMVTANTQVTSAAVMEQLSVHWNAGYMITCHSVTVSA